jgi:hypothetical protein
MKYTTGTCTIEQLRHRMMSRHFRSKVGTAAVRALTEMIRAHKLAQEEMLCLIMVGVGVVDWESGHAMTLYPNKDNTVTWYYHAGQAADTAWDYRQRAQIMRVTHYPSEGRVLTDGMC